LRREAIPLAGLAVRQTLQIRAEFAGDPAGNLLSIGQRHAADQMNPVSLIGHQASPSQP